jgi:hypothetical protein
MERKGVGKSGDNRQYVFQCCLIGLDTEKEVFSLTKLSTAVTTGIATR